MNLRDKIETDYKNALKSKDKNKISTYRLILAGIKDLDIQNRSGPQKKETDDEDIKKLLKKMIKQRSESIEVYKKIIEMICWKLNREKFWFLANICRNNLATRKQKKFVQI